ncbi:DNA methyltransferase [Devosia submarina]|uniref:DNA methyltransferase n=1 Tax=Devosia submarina TaxID=1173082 RepID=UPI001FE52B6B|nr:DNA methyltransferase [Devosia submarina]
MQNNSKPGDAVYEPFNGSGTTIIAAELENRRCYAAELSPEYVDVTVLRWQAFTGREAKLSTGQTFAQVAEGRGVETDEREA